MKSRKKIEKELLKMAPELFEVQLRNGKTAIYNRKELEKGLKMLEVIYFSPIYRDKQIQERVRSKETKNTRKKIEKELLKMANSIRKIIKVIRK